ncbi:MAG TPA: uracil-DNA glycosylase [bacterium]
MNGRTHHQHLKALQDQIVACRKCPRLVDWRERVAEEKVRRFAGETYWGRPVPSFGDPNARLLIVGLAPAAHGGNRTGRIFTGDRSGDWLFGTLHRFGFANQPTSISRDDGLVLNDCYITAALHCAPPQNKPTLAEKQNCFSFFLQELRYLRNLQVIVALGKLAFDSVLSACRQNGIVAQTKPFAFAHNSEAKINSRITLLASYHPSQQNTFTGKLTQPMFDAVFRRAREICQMELH